jgi:hypothetical protein
VPVSDGLVPLVEKGVVRNVTTHHKEYANQRERRRRSQLRP